MMIALALSLVLSAVPSGYCLCPKSLRVKIPAESIQADHSVFFGNMTFTRDQYFEQNGELWACPCLAKACIRKCCPAGKELVKVSTELPSCQPSNEYLQVNVYDPKTSSNTEKGDFFIIHNMICPKGHEHYKLEQVNILKNGSLFDDYSVDKPDMYCVDYLNGSKIALFCGKPDVDYWKLLVCFSKY
ncbi:hypothetical protein GWI33_005489 [Rhynchophorus ferrugineus]|uniref:Methuselah N-terminal domain-containing protein n=1 Tax=Rhynchophorus ferrugineus TaxID=354439 RepID=A0A834MG17_RHYFE|nr:hypothetical protein GWI33_005489 [Rhynchophorus ferrugineus]